jgi:hypothetical protein
MALELPAQPNFSAAVPPSSSPLDQYGKMLQLKALQGQQQLIPLQVQEQQEKVKQAQTLQSEQQQIELQGQKALTAYWSNPGAVSVDSEISRTTMRSRRCSGSRPTIR